jgi:hypothetical protein
VAGVGGPTPRRRLDEAALARSRSATMPSSSRSPGTTRRCTRRWLTHCRAVAEVMPVIGFYLQPAVGGRRLDHTLLARLRRDSRGGGHQGRPVQPLPDARRRARGRRGGPRRRRPLHRQRRQHRRRPAHPVHLPHRRTRRVTRHIDGGLLGQWAVWTRSRRARCWTNSAAVRAEAPRRRARTASVVPAARAYRSMLARGVALTDANAAVFDASPTASPAASPGSTRSCAARDLLAGDVEPRPAPKRSRPGQAAAARPGHHGLSRTPRRRLRRRRARSLAGLNDSGRRRDLEDYASCACHEDEAGRSKWAR